MSATNVYNEEGMIIEESGAEINGKSCVVRGSNCTVNGAGCDVSGHHCTVNGFFCIVKGDHCTVNGDSCIVKGDHCTVNGNNCIVKGNRCQIYGGSCSVLGLRCTRHEERVQPLLDYGNVFTGTIVQVGRENRASGGRYISGDYVEEKKDQKKSIVEYLRGLKDTLTEDEKKACTICQENESIIAFSCGHKKTCVRCSLVLAETTKKCPICRENITGATRIFE